VPLDGAPDGMIVNKNVMLPMRAGVRLALDIHRPGGPGKYPGFLDVSSLAKSKHPYRAAQPITETIVITETGAESVSRVSRANCW